MRDLNPAFSDLMRKALQGDERAYRTLLTALTPVVRRLALRLSKGDTSLDVEDVVQETLLAIHTKRHTWDDSRPLLPWVHAVARHKFVDLLRRAGRHTAPLEDVSEALMVAPAAAGCEGIDVRRILEFLKGRNRAIVASICLEGASTREVAARLGITEVAVRVAYHRGLTMAARAVGAR